MSYAELKTAVFLDRDGTIARDVPYCRRPEDFALLPGTVQGIKLLNRRGLKVILVTNQSGVARGYFTLENLAKIHLKLENELAAGGAHLDGIYYCPHHPDDNCDCRKPKPGMLLKCATEMDIDLSHSYIIGDSIKDIEAGQEAGCHSILISNNSHLDKCLVPSPSMSVPHEGNESGGEGQGPPRTGYEGEGEYFGKILSSKPDYITRDFTDAVRWLVTNVTGNNEGFQ